jgi:eukaryotic-like serine/threonine-protein kinase
VQPPADVYYNGLRFSPDGNYFYFVRSDPGNPELKFLYRAPLLGGTPEKLVGDVDSNVTFSQDGKKYAFMRYDNPERGKYRLLIRSVDGEDENTLASGPTSASLYDPVWSPDGKVIVCKMIDVESGFIRLVAVDAKTGQSKAFYSSNTQVIDKPSWLPDGSGVLGLVREQSNNFTRNQIAFVSYPRGVYSPVTRDTNSYYDLSVAGTGHVLATVQNQYSWNLMVMPAADSGGRIRSISSADDDMLFTWTKDNQIVSDQGNMLNLIDPANGRKTVLPAQSLRAGPAACGTTGSTVFVTFEAGAQNLWLMDPSGVVKQITNGKLDVLPACSQDGKWVFYMNQVGEPKLEKAPTDGGTPQTVSELPLFDGFDLSPDGRLAAFPTLEHSGEHKEELAVVDASDGKTLKVVDFERPRVRLLRFARDGKAVVYATRENGVDNLWSQPLDGSKGHSLTDFKSEHIYDFHWSLDGKQLALVRGHTDSDVVLIKDQGQ